MTSLQTKKDELDLIRSIYTPEELVFGNPSLLSEFDSTFSKEEPVNKDLDIRLTLKINFPEASAEVG